ncbi:hypothetical protein GCM10009780_81220 [Actinomadura alba]
MTANASPEALAQAVRAAGVSDERLIEAVRVTPGAGFVPADRAACAASPSTVRVQQTVADDAVQPAPGHRHAFTYWG